jgi:hypothetical protein
MRCRYRSLQSGSSLRCCGFVEPQSRSRRIDQGRPRGDHRARAERQLPPPANRRCRPVADLERSGGSSSSSRLLAAHGGRSIVAGCSHKSRRKAEGRAGQGLGLKRSALRGAKRHVPCDARSIGQRRNSLHSLRSFRSNSRRGSAHEARLRRAADCPALLRSLAIRPSPCPARPSALFVSPRRAGIAHHHRRCKAAGGLLRR